jgi:SAM-dependent methyltransferase
METFHRRYRWESYALGKVTRLGSSTVTDREQALSFGKAAALYESVRPGYPQEAAQWALGAGFAIGRGTVIDLGAGTGLLTRMLLTLAGRVIPIEPDPEMRAQLTAAVPGVVAVEGTAESIPYADASVDSILTAQAYHWFDTERAHPEIARVVRTGGTFAAIWNLRDSTIGWVAALEEAAGPAPAGHVRNPELEVTVDFGPSFDLPERGEFRHNIAMTADRVHALVASRSTYLVAPAAERAEIDARVAAVTAQLPRTFAMPYVTVCYRATRR